MYFIIKVEYSIPVTVLFKTEAHTWIQTSELQGENLYCLRYYQIIDAHRQNFMYRILP